MHDFGEAGKTSTTACLYKTRLKVKWLGAGKKMVESLRELVYGVELKPDFSGVMGEPILQLRPPVTMDDKQAEWESRSVTSREVNRRWTEGSFIFKNGDTYYMMYSANYFGGKNYAVGYATSKNPLGPFTKASNNPVLQKTRQGWLCHRTDPDRWCLDPDGNECFRVSRPHHATGRRLCY